MTAVIIERSRAQHPQRAVERDERRETAARRRSAGCMPNSASIATRSCITLGSIVAAGPDVVGHQPGERSLQVVGRRRVGDARRPARCRRAAGSRRAGDIANMMSTTAACWIGSRRPTAPKSISPSVPSASTNTLPGCGSAWKKPSAAPDRASTAAAGRRAPLGRRPSRRALPSRPRCSPRSAPARAPAACTSCSYTTGMRTPAALSRRAAISAIASASTAEVELGAQALGELLEHLARPDAAAERRAPLGEVGEQPSAARSRSIVSSMPGRCTLTTTASPVMQPRPMGLADRRRGERLPVELGEDRRSRSAPSSASSTAAIRPAARAAACFCSWASSSQTSARQQVDSRCRDLTELDVDAAGLLEHAPQPHARRCRPALGAVGVRRERPEAFPPGEPDQLAVAPEHGDAPADGAQRARRDHEPGPLADGQRARPGEQVERDRGGHRRRDADREDVQRRGRRRPSPSG